MKMNFCAAISLTLANQLQEFLKQRWSRSNKNRANAGELVNLEARKVKDSCSFMFLKALHLSSEKLPVFPEQPTPHVWDELL